MGDARLEQALHDFEATANDFAVRYLRMAQIRLAYVEQIKEMSQSIKAAVEGGELAARKGAELAHQLRDEILQMQRARDFDFGRALAAKMKAKGLTLEQVIQQAMEKLGLRGLPFQQLTEQQQYQVYMEVIEKAGRSRPSVTLKIPRMQWAARGLWLATFAIAGYNIGTAENPWWQSGREGTNIGGGLAGSIAGGAAMGAAGGVWAGPVGIAIGVLVGGILGALLSDHIYVEAAGTSDPETRQFISRFTSLWAGVDEEGMARALATEHRQNSAFVMRVFTSLDKDYHTDVDDVAVKFIAIAKKDSSIAQILRCNRTLKDQLIRVLSEGWTGADEQQSISYLHSL